MCYLCEPEQGRCIKPGNCDEANDFRLKPVYEAAPVMLEALKEVEWIYAEREDDGCPCCGLYKRDGHSPSCKLGNALSKAQGKEVL